MEMKCEQMMLGGKLISVNGKPVMSCGWFAYDGCHKIYVCESKEDIDEAMMNYYRIYPIHELRKAYDMSCPLRFIYNQRLTTRYVEQDEVALWKGTKPTTNNLQPTTNN